MSLRAIIFDMDGTITDTIQLVCYAARQAFEYIANCRYSDSDIVAMFGPPDDAFIRSHVSPELAKVAVEYYSKTYENAHDQFVRDSADIQSVFQCIKDEWGLKIGVYTGKGRRTSSYSLDRLGLSPYVDVLLTGNEVHDPKPAPDGILNCLMVLEADPTEAVYVGDTYVDVLAARAAGVSPLLARWYYPGELEPQHEYEATICTTTAELLEWIDLHRR